MDKEVVIVLLAAFLFIVGSVGAVYFANVAGCNDIQKSTLYESKYTVFGGCYVKVNNKWIPNDAWRVVEGDKD